jgi:hypothetical protein
MWFGESVKAPTFSPQTRIKSEIVYGTSLFICGNGTSSPWLYVVIVSIFSSENENLCIIFGTLITK